MSLVSTSTDLPSIAVRATQDLPRTRLYSMMVSANEQGSGYWARVIRESVPLDPDVSWMDDPEDIKRWPQHGAALCGGKVIYGVLDDSTGRVGRKRYTLDADAIRQGLKVMQEQEPRHFAAFISEEDDAETADVFLQCCLLGKVVYG